MTNIAYRRVPPPPGFFGHGARYPSVEIFCAGFTERLEDITKSIGNMSQNVGTKLLNSFRRPQSSVRLDVLVRSISLSSHIYRATSESKEKWSEPLNFVDGKRVDPCSQDESGSFFVVEPASGKILCEAKSSGKDEVDRAVRSAREAFDGWSEKSGLERGKILRKAADIIRKRLNDIATVETIDSGRIYIYVEVF